MNVDLLFDSLAQFIGVVQQGAVQQAPPVHPEVAQVAQLEIPGPLVVGMVLSLVSAIGTFIFWTVKSLGGRVVKQEEERLGALQRQQDRHEAELKVLSGAHIQMQADIRTLTTSVEKVATQLERLSLSHRDEMRELAASIDKKLDEVEMRMRQDTMRVIADSFSRAKRGRT
jgi:chromosome segregation ATPase